MSGDFCNAMDWNFFLQVMLTYILKLMAVHIQSHLAETICFHVDLQKGERFRKTKEFRETFYNISNMSKDMSVCT